MRSCGHVKTVGKAHLAIVLCFFATSPVLAEEVLYCVDTNTTGFAWDKNGKAKAGLFNVERHTVKVVSDTERLITPTEGDTAGKAYAYECKQYDEVVLCRGTPLPLLDVWQFYPDGYTRAFLSGGPPASGRDRNIVIAYGTCTKF